MYTTNLRKAMAGGLLAVALAPAAWPAGGLPERVLRPQEVWADFDGDGLADLFVVNPAGADRLFRNAGDGRLQDVSAGSGLDHGDDAALALAVDFDGDDNLDLLVLSRTGEHSLYLGSGDARFVERSRDSGVREVGKVREASWLDYDQDGRPDLRVLDARGDLRFFHNVDGSRLEAVELDLPFDPAKEASLVGSAPVFEGGDGHQHGGGPESAATIAPAERPEEREDSVSRPVAGSTRPPVELEAIRTEVPDRASGSASPPQEAEAPQQSVCATSLKDQAGGPCIKASSQPTLGMLYPIGSKLYVGSSGAVGLGTTAPTAGLHVNVTSGSFALKVKDDLFVDSNLSFTGVNRSNRISANEYFGVYTPTGSGIYGGMYVDTQNSLGLPFYGFSTAGAAKAWTYFDPSTSQVRIYNVGDRLAVDSSGFVGINRTSPISGADVLTVGSPVTGANIYGGMYVDTAGASSLPFYGFSTAGAAKAWTYFDPSTAQVRIYNGGARLNVDLDGFVGVNRTNPVTGADVLNVGSPVTAANAYGGMYVDTAGTSSWPFYGYSTGSAARAWHYYDSSASTWRLSVGGDRLSVTNFGDVGIGVSAPTRKLTVVGTVSGDHPIATQWDTYSSRRWKKNIATLEGALEAVQQLRGVTYELKSTGESFIGFIAEEVGEVLPTLVSYADNGVDAESLDYARISAVLVEAVKEQQALIEQQAERLAAQQDTLARLGEDVQLLRETIATQGIALAAAR